jgi:hypothetical protein
MLGAGLLLAGCLALGPTGTNAQLDEAQACTGRLTQQLRRYSERCISDLVGYVTSQPGMEAKIYSEGEKFYVLLANDAKGFRAEAPSKFNFPMMRDETAAELKRLGWAAPENEGDNWKKEIGAGSPDAVARDVAQALEAYGLQKGQAISLTVDTRLTK